ncbi:alpha/beta hydrolase [Paludisphaera rhizosphaerae]|uniref:alpha/beta hydrolase n=1 Tax=Paludisphaera rhizosphaerae TaxID=2711216 RepID=UPI0013EB801A|nr:alpha/beta fold hydrolase [Paludisphaera rhizosphaerae]
MIRVLPILLLTTTTAWAADLKDDARKFLELCQTAKYDEAYARFGPKMAAALPKEKLAEVWTNIGGQLGPIESMAEPQEDRIGASRRVKILCRFKPMTLEALISYDPDGKIEGFFLNTPTPPAAPKAEPPYVDRAKYTEEDVVVGADGWPLPGTLARPKGLELPALVVLVQGSGPHDRDETIGPNAPFRDLAHGLASRGVAVLRYDKRTRTHKSRYADPKAGAAVVVQDEVVDDALASVAKARTWKGIAPNRIFVLGHSLGATTAPMIAEQDGRLAGVILLAASTRPSADVVREQSDYVRKVDPVRAKGLDALDAKLDEHLTALKAGTLGDDDKVLGGAVRYWKSMDATRPAQRLAEQPNLPALILQGGRDYQVTEADLEAFRRVLPNRPNVTIKLYPDLNHTFMKGEGKATPSEYDKPGFVDVRVVEDIAAWVGSVPSH